MWGSGLIACNMITAAVLFAVPVHDKQVVAQQPIQSSTAIVNASTSAAVPDRQEQVRTSPQPSPNLGEGGAPLPNVGGGGEGVRTVIERPAATASEQVKAETRDSAPIPIRIPILAPSTVLDAMHAYAATSSTFTFGGKEHIGLGFFVSEINGKREGDGYYWILYLNGKTADLGASQLTVKPIDIVEWRFEKGY